MPSLSSKGTQVWRACTHSILKYNKNTSFLEGIWRYVEKSKGLRGKLIWKWRRENSWCRKPERWSLFYIWQLLVLLRNYSRHFLPHPHRHLSFLSIQWTPCALVTFLSLLQNTVTKQLKEGLVLVYSLGWYFLMGEATVAGAWGSSLHCLSSQEAENGECPCSAHFLLFIQSRIPA